MNKNSEKTRFHSNSKRSGYKPSQSIEVHYDPHLDEANRIAEADVKICLGRKFCGCQGCSPAAGKYSGVWVVDALWPFCDSLVYWMNKEEIENYLYSETQDNMGVIPFFIRMQEREGQYEGNIPISKSSTGSVSYGGMFDHTYKPTKNHRDDVFFSSAWIIHAIHRYWKLFDDATYIAKYYNALYRYVDFRKKAIDLNTYLFRSTYGLGDVCLPHSIPESCALIETNAACVRMFSEFSEMSKAIGKNIEADEFYALRKKIIEGINTNLWSNLRGRFEVKIFSELTSDQNSPVYGMKEDNHFFVYANMILLYYDIPDTKQKVNKLMTEIEKAEQGMKVWGRSIVPPFSEDALFMGSVVPKGIWFQELMEHQYWNGGSWPAFASWYSIALFRLGHPDRAIEILFKQASVAIRDKAFYEYYEADTNGKKRGGSHYCFTAAPYQRALVEGLFGLDADYGMRKISIRPSLRHSGRITCQLGKHKIDLSLEVDNGTKTIKLHVFTTYSGPVDFRILIENNVSNCHVTKGTSMRIPNVLQQIGEGNYVNFESEIKPGSNNFLLTTRGIN